ncbi:hypothetical protein CD178_00789 [Komagataeibacter saccharivorans]|uniref:Uncharacterized protein n=2 Tax=Komagataeibacter saccharivorans TaxID=265959 RepID=A0A347W9Q0_9PROT|nr:hypothetical protein CD178_00789 [Komagataeibacter saccharivorans]
MRGPVRTVGISGQEMMFDSKIIEVDGVFVGAAIITGIATSLRFYATHESVRSLHNAILPDLAALRHRVTATFRRIGTQGGVRGDVKQIAGPRPAQS